MPLIPAHGLTALRSLQTVGIVKQTTYFFFWLDSEASTTVCFSELSEQLLKCWKFTLEYDRYKTCFVCIFQSSDWSAALAQASALSPWRWQAEQRLCKGRWPRTLLGWSNHQEKPLHHLRIYGFGLYANKHQMPITETVFKDNPKGNKYSCSLSHVTQHLLFRGLINQLVKNWYYFNTSVRTYHKYMRNMIWAVFWNFSFRYLSKMNAKLKIHCWSRTEHGILIHFIQISANC